VKPNNNLLHRGLCLRYITFFLLILLMPLLFVLFHAYVVRSLKCVDDVIACVISCELVQHVPQVTHPPQRWRSAAEGPHLKTDQQRSPIRAHAGRHGRAAVLLPTVVRHGPPASRKESTL